MIMLLAGCQKREAGVVQQNPDESPPIQIASTVDVKDDPNPSIPEGVRSLQEIIASSPHTAPELRSPSSGTFAFQIQGNFTGSSSREFIAFYENSESNPEIIRSIESVFCVVLDSTGGKIESVYRIPYGTLRLREDDIAQSGLLEAESLGKEIIWRDQMIGRVGDYNGDGKEELYLYTLTGMERRPYFFGFDESKFVELLNFGVVNAYITHINQEEKGIDILIDHLMGDSPFKIVENNSYKWDEITCRYELVITETKKYRWDWDSQEYIELPLSEEE
jgi:hypothetical protein